MNLSLKAPKPVAKKKLFKAFEAFLVSKLKRKSISISGVGVVSIGNVEVRRVVDPTTTLGQWLSL